MAKAKEPKYVSEKHDSTSTKELIKKWENYHADTPEAAEKREKEALGMTRTIRSFDDVQNQYFLDKKREDHSLDKDARHKEAKEVVNAILLNSIEHEFGKDAAKMYKKHPGALSAYFTGHFADQGVSYNHLIKDLKDNYKDISRSELLTKIKQILASKVTKEGEEKRSLERAILENEEHHNAFKNKANNNFQNKYKKTIDPVLSIGQHMSHYKQSLLGNVNEDYFRQNDTHFKKYDAKKKAA